MLDITMNEKEQIQKATVDAFVELFNACEKQDFVVEQYGDAPDATCTNSAGKIMQVEVTLTEDRPGDLPWILGRFNERPCKSRTGSHLQGNVLQQLAKRLDDKATKRYGKGTALVIRDSSGVDWDWEDVSDEVKRLLKDKANPFDMGIWVVNRENTGGTLVHKQLSFTWTSPI
jgi:hypothetical protein